MLLYVIDQMNDEDREKAEWLYNNYKKTMVYIARNILQNAEDVEDAVSDACYKIFSNLDKIPDVTCNKTKGFVVVVVRNAAINIYNRRKTVTKNSSAAPIEIIEDLSESTLDKIIAAETIERTMEALAQLKTEYADILRLRIIYDCNNKALTELLGESDANVRVRLHRARLALRQKLTEMEGVL